MKSSKNSFRIQCFAPACAFSLRTSRDILSGWCQMCHIQNECVRIGKMRLIWSRYLAISRSPSQFSMAKLSESCVARVDFDSAQNVICCTVWWLRLGENTFNFKSNRISGSTNFRCFHSFESMITQNKIATTKSIVEIFNELFRPQRDCIATRKSFLKIIFNHDEQKNDENTLGFWLKWKSILEMKKYPRSCV